MHAREGESIDFSAIAEDVARELLGEPNKALSNEKELRWGSHGSFSLDRSKGVWHDHERGEGGGVLDMIRRERGLVNGQALDWLQERGFIPPRSAHSQRRIVATYDYTDEAGALLFQVCRMEPKDFRQRRPDGRGGWVWKLGDCRRVLYRLPDLIAAPPDAPVFVVEGEKDADALRALGCVATTNPQGAGKWRDEYAGCLMGRRVVVIPDNDAPGAAHAETVRASLRKAGIRAAILRLDGLKAKGDASDWIAGGGDAAELARRAEAALEGENDADAHSGKRPSFELVRADALEFREPDWLVRDLLETGRLSQIFGDPGCGKTFAALDVACCVATGRAFHGREVKQGGVIYLAGEGFSGLARRKRAWELHNGASLAGAPLFFSKCAAQMLDAASAQAVTEAVDAIAPQAGDVRLIVVDTLARNFGPGSESDTADMSRFVAALDDLKDRYGANALIVHHTGHGDKQRGRGSMALFGALDHEFRIERSDTSLTMICTKMKDAPEPAPLGFEMLSVDLGMTDRNGEPVTSAALRIAEAQARRPKMSAAQRRALDTHDRARVAQGDERDPGAWVHVDQWRPFFYETCTADTPAGKRQAFHRVRNELFQMGLLTVSEDKYARVI